MRARRRVAPSKAKPLDSSVRKGKINFVRGHARVPGRQTEPPEEVLRHAVVPDVLGEAVSTGHCKARLTGTPYDEVLRLECHKMVERGGGTNTEPPGHCIERCTALPRLQPGDHPEDIQLSGSHTLEWFHNARQRRGPYEVYPNN